MFVHCTPKIQPQRYLPPFAYRLIIYDRQQQYKISSHHMNKNNPDKYAFIAQQTNQTRSFRYDDSVRDQH